MRLLFIDNYDSFTYNVAHLLASVGAEPEIVLNDDPSLVPSLLQKFDALVVGPGPGTPSQQPQMMEMVQGAIERGMPVFGVCLGLQAIAYAFGAAIVHAPRQMHGKTSAISHDDTGVFAGMSSPFIATRYHSLVVDAQTLPPELRVTATSNDGVVQGIAHRTLPIEGVQFHPESVLSEQGELLMRNFINRIGEA